MIVFEMKCKLGVKKTYRLNVEDTNPINAVYFRDSCPNRLASRPKLFEDCINNFHSSLLSITMSLNRQYVRFKSYSDNDISDNADIVNRRLQTEMTLDANDFDKYIIQGESDIDLTFSLREMKSILSFCESANQPIQLYFSEVGQPMIAYTKMFNLFESDFVIATLKDGMDEDRAEESTQSSNKSSAYSQMSQNNFYSGNIGNSKSGVSSIDKMENEVYKAMGGSGSNTLDDGAIWLNDLDKEMEYGFSDDSDEVHSD